MMFFYLIKTKIKHFISNQSNIWYEITARRTNRKVLWCSGYHVCFTRRGSPVQACTASRQVFDKMMFFYLIKTKIKHLISNQSHIWYEITARRTNRKVLWCSGYDVCITRRRSPVQAWTASRQVFDKKMFFFTWSKLKSSIWFLINQTFDMKLLLEELIARCCDVVVITSALHAEGLQFKPWQHQGKLLTKWCFFTWLKLRSSILFLINPTIDMKLLLEELISRCCGVGVMTSA